jgi:hypothetical protein
MAKGEHGQRLTDTIDCRIAEIQFEMSEIDFTKTINTKQSKHYENNRNTSVQV